MRSSLTSLFSKKERPYQGVELRPHFLLTELGIRGSGLGAFIGPCSVRTEHLVDWEDRLAGDRIEARRMVHFLGEFFGMSLREGVLIQRVFMSVLLESLRGPLEAAGFGGKCLREGDDLFIESRRRGDGTPEPRRKLSVSIVTASPVSLLLHVGINIDPTGAPVPAVGLDELGIAAESWVPRALERMVEEWEGMDWACAKVRPVM